MDSSSTVDIINDTIYNIIRGVITETDMQLITSFDANAQDICYARLYQIYSVPQFYNPNSSFAEYYHISDANQRFAIKTKFYSAEKSLYHCERTLPERYSQYEVLKEQFAFDFHCLRNGNNTGAILQYPTNKYIKHENLLLKVFNYTGVLMPFADNTSYKLAFIKSIIDNKDNLDDTYLVIIDKYLAECCFYESGLRIGIAEQHLRMMLGYHSFIIILNKLLDSKIPFNFNTERYLETHRSEIEQLEDKSLKLSIYFNINSLLKGNLTTSARLLELVGLQRYRLHEDYTQDKCFNKYFNIISQYYHLFEVDNLIKFMEDNMEYTMQLLDWRNMDFIFAIVFRAYNYLLKNEGIKDKHIDFFNLLDTKFYNLIMRYDSYLREFKFLLRRVEEDDDNKRLKDEEGRVICIVCLEDLTGKSIKCVRCEKYIGHPACITKCVAGYKKCPYCNVGY